jgi:hypothetical protein
MASSLPPGGPSCLPYNNTLANSRCLSPLRKPSQRPARHQPRPHSGVLSVANQCSSSEPSLPRSVVPHEQAPHPRSFFSFFADPSPGQLALARLDPVSLPQTTLHPTRFHVQLSYRCRTNDWESFFSHIRLVLNPKSNLRSPALGFVQLGLMRRRSEPSL